MKFCFWGDIADAIKGKTIGGGELQVALLAKSLAAEGHEVVVIDPSHAESFTTSDGIKVFHVPGWNKGVPVLRIFVNRLPALYRLFKAQQADYYYVRMRSYFNLLPYLASRANKSRFLLALASDIDLLSLRGKFKSEYKAKFNLFKYLTQWLPNDLVFRFLLRRADVIISQHQGQWDSISRNRGKKVLFPNIIDRSHLPSRVNGEKPFYAYIGSLTMVKGADKLYDIISSAEGKADFLVVGQPNDPGAVPIFEQLKNKPNARMLGRKSHDETIGFMRPACALINTSEYEGFPNVFLEAWSMGIPVLSYKVSPGDIISRYNLGVCFNGDLEKMKAYINAGRIPDVKEQELKDYITRNHDFINAGKRFCLVITS
jgi:glycosyltransferase involved in cell wall biosynthesis